MTTTNTYNPLLSAFRELTTPQAFRWYGTQAKATATLAQTIALRSFTTAQRLLSDRNSIAIAPSVAEPETAESLCVTALKELAIAPTIAPAVQGDSVAVEGLENAKSLCEAIATYQEYELPEATEPQESPVLDEWELIEPNETMQAQREPELNDSECDCLAIDELEQAKATHQEYAQAEAIAPEPDFGNAESLCEAIAGDSDAELAWFDAALLDDEDPTERRYWSGEDDAEALAGDEA